MSQGCQQRTLYGANQPFGALLGAVMAKTQRESVRPNPRLRVPATLRADFLSESTAEPALASLLRAGTFVLGPPGPAALADIVRSPAERAGLDLEDGLADEILRDAGGVSGALPLIAFCLEELYQRTTPEHRFTRDAYRAMDGLRGAISQRAGKLMAEFRDIEGADLDAALSHIFENLVRVDAGKAARLLRGLERGRPARNEPDRSKPQRGRPLVRYSGGHRSHKC